MYVHITLSKCKPSNAMQLCCTFFLSCVCKYSVLPCWYGMTCYIFCIYDFLIYYFKMNIIAECAFLCCTVYITGCTPHLQVSVPILN